MAAEAHRIGIEVSASVARRAGALLARSANAWIDHRAGSKGAALAFYTLFSMAPILILAIAGAGYFFGAEAAQGEIIAQLEGLVGREGAQAIQALLAGARNPASGLVATVAAGVLLLVSLALSAALAVLERMAGGAGSYEFFALASSALSFAAITCLFAVIFKVLPDAPLSWRDVWIGAAFTAGLFTIGKYAIGLYLGNSAVASSFGAAGSLIALLLWVYYSSQIFFFGAELTRHYALEFGSLRGTAK